MAKYCLSDVQDTISAGIGGKVATAEGIPTPDTLLSSQEVYIGEVPSIFVLPSFPSKVIVITTSYFTQINFGSPPLSFSHRYRINGGGYVAHDSWTWRNTPGYSTAFTYHNVVSMGIFSPTGAGSCTIDLAYYVYNTATSTAIYLNSWKILAIVVGG